MSTMIIECNIKKYSIPLVGMLLLSILLGCSSPDREGDKTSSSAITTNYTINEDQSWAERMAQSIMKRHPSAWQIEGREEKKWAYTHGLVALAFLKLWEQTGDNRYFAYAKGYADDLINAEGEIYNYEITDFNIDNVNAGKILFPLYEQTQDERYKKAIETLRTQLTWQPRTTVGGFWHKRRYPWQMWLDGLYMGAPYYAQYATLNGEESAFDDIAQQFILMEQFARDEKTGLLYHGWDESHLQRWANEVTGLSPHFWGRSLGWYAMGLVDVLDYFPADHPQREELIAILQRLATAMVNFQDEDTGLWYQVLDKADQEGNYQEATVSSMMAYVFFKATRKGYLEPNYREYGVKAFNGIVDDLLKVEETGEVHITKCCAVAGLGGKPYRDGSYEYYVNEEVRDNDPKATGPFILASIEYELLGTGTKY